MMPGTLRAVQLRIAVLATIVGLAVATLAGCGSSGAPNQNPSPVPGASSNGHLTIGIPFDEPGLGQKKGNTYSGFEVETAEYVAKALGVPEQNITWKEANPGDREQLLANGEVDLIFSTYSITDERKLKVDFAGPYFVAHQDLLIRRNDTAITGPDTLDGRKLCSVPGTTSAVNVSNRYVGITLQEYPTFSQCVAALEKGQVDAVTTDDVILAGYAAEPQYRGKLMVVGKGFSDEYYGVGIKKGDTELVRKVNDALQEYIRDGSWRKALEVTVGPSGYRIPDPPQPGSM